MKHLREGIKDPELDYRADPHTVGPCMSSHAVVPLLPQAILRREGAGGAPGEQSPALHLLSAGSTSRSIIADADK